MANLVTILIFELMLNERKCKVCGVKFKKLQPLQYVCSVDCALRDSKIKQGKKAKKEWSEKKKILSEKLMTKSDYEKQLQIEINHIARIIDKGHPCIATGSTKGKTNGGHYFSVGSFPSLRFNLFNIYLQSEHSNSYKAGDNIRYADGLKQTFGQSHFDYLETLRQKYPSLKLSIPELKEAISKAKEAKKKLLGVDEKYTNHQRLRLRELLNKEIGIYLD